GAAARMLSAAYALLGLETVDGALRLRADAFEAKGDLRLEQVTYRGATFTAASRNEKATKVEQTPNQAELLANGKLSE
ncbi:MAG: hypothetical protein C3F11_21045, partial [Methylocystaceae bacterium]